MLSSTTLMNPQYKKLASTYKPLYVVARSAWHTYLRIPHLIEKIRLRKFSSPTIINTHDNFLILIDPCNGRVDEQIFLHKQWESQLCGHIKSLLPADGVFVDVGGNIGYISLFAASYVPQGTVHYFEPIPNLVEQSKKSIQRNGYSNITQYNVGCGATKGFETLYINKENIGASGVYSSGDTSIKITIDALDNLLGHLDRIDLIKIDVEGYELSALQGMLQILKIHQPHLLIEFSPTLYKNPEDGKKILQLLFKNNYKITDIYLDITYHRMQDIDLKFLDILGQTDFLCTPADK